MNDERPVWHIGIIFVIGALLFIALVAVVKFSTTVPAIDADRATLIPKRLSTCTQRITRRSTPSVGWTNRAASCDCRLKRRCKLLPEKVPPLCALI